MKWFCKINEDEFDYINECCADIVFAVEESNPEDDTKSLIKINNLIKKCNQYCDNWNEKDKLNFKNFTNQHMLWFCLTYVRHHDENYKIEFDDWDKAIKLEKQLENL